MLKSLGEKIDSESVLLSALTRACKLHYNTIQIKLPVQKGLLTILVNSIEKMFADNPQPYILKLYIAIFVSAYYGLLQISELARGSHAILAKNVHIGTNKKKIMFILKSSKTHNQSDKPQIIKLDALPGHVPSSQRFYRHMCPFKVLKDYIQIQKPRKSEDEQLFVWHDRFPITQSQLRRMFQKLLLFNNFDCRLYKFHGIRAGWATDLMDMGILIKTIKKLGRWKSSSIYAYLRS